uniref:Ion transport domain-containing protein n=1 Tax=Rhizophagus irregularis (strain DAOM 181602 / DAOM 197198 / MUCL 43194) TaxID=747089 RepID=U9SXG5_RHIID
MSQIDDEIYVEIDDKIDNNNDIHYKIDIDNDINKPHNGKLVTKIEVSPNEKYLVTYSKDDHSIVGWNIESKDKSQLKLDKTFKLSDMILLQMCVSDNKKLAYINENKYLEIYDMKKNQKIKLDCDPRFSHYYYCTFNLNGEFILYGRFDRIIFIYSTRTKNNKWNCKRMYKKQNNFKFISISKYNKLYSFSNNSIYEYNLITEKSKKIFGSNEKITNKNIRISSNEKFICIRIINKLIIYSIELEIPIASWDINNDTQLHNFVYRAGLIPLLLPLLNDSTIMEHYWNECLDWLRGKGQLSNEYQTESLSDIIRTTTKYVFGILDGHIWKIKFEEILSKMNLTFENTDENIENWYFDNDFKISNEIHKTYDHLNIHLIKPSMGMDTIYALFQKVKPHSKNKKELESSQNLIKWEISTIDTYKIRLQVFKKINVNNQWNEEDLICTRVENVNESYSINLLGIKLLDDSDIVILTTIGILIYNFSENNKSISLNYYYYMNIDRYSSNIKWMGLDVKNNKSSLLKYGVELLTFGIKEHNLELIEDIYKTCIKYFNEDLRNNRMYLSIITSTMPLLSEYYPEYISRYSLETTMIIDPSFYSIKYENINLHLYSFQYHQMIFKHTTTPTITFMIPYINFVNYSKDYNWFLELIRPQPSPFTKTINRNIYKTWNGEALINFKWNAYGKYYYAMIWILFMALLGCFTAAATIPQQYINEEVRQQLFIASIILGFIHLIFEIRQFFYNITKWFYNFWNIFGKYIFIFNYFI